jgi:NitT/TauT family transport system substrate-binding protein
MRLTPAGTTPRDRRKRHESKLPSRARLFFAVASGLAVAAAAGCSASNGAGGSFSGTITIVAVPGIDDAPLYLAQQDGLFTAAGLQHVVIKTESQEAAEFSALQGNTAQIAATDYGNVLAAQEQPGSGGYRILADGYDATTGSLEVLTLPGSKIKSPAELQGKTVGVPSDDILPNMPAGAPDSLESAAVTQVLSNYIGNAPNAVTWRPMTQAQEVAALVSHRIPAIVVGEPYIFQAEQEAGAVEIMDACSGFTLNLPLSGYVATSKWVNLNPTAVADFKSAISQAQADASMAGPIQKILHKYTGMTMQEAELATIGTYPTTTSEKEIARDASLLYLESMIKNQPRVQQMIVR